MANFQNQNRPPGQNDTDPHDFVAIVVGLGAAFLCANPLFELTQDSFREIAVTNYGYGALEAFEMAYRIFLHVAIFGIARVTTKLALAAIITAVGYRLALAV